VSFFHKHVLVGYCLVAVVSAAIGATVAYWVEVQIWRAGAVATFLRASLEYRAGRVDEATILSAEAAAEDPNRYEPFSLLGAIYTQKGNQALALELHQEALQREQKLPDSPLERRWVEREIKELERETHDHSKSPGNQ
jgi:tetratricopeptide (TPR) repeat protein